MNSRPWTKREEQKLRTMIRQDCWSNEAIASELRRTPQAIKTRITKLKLRRPSTVRRVWTPAECDLLRAEYGQVPAAELAQRLDRPVQQVYQAADRLGLTQGKPQYVGLDAFIRRYHAQGWSDAEITRAWCERPGSESINRRSLGDRRQKLGLSHNAYSQHRRLKVAARTREQLDRKGLASLAMERVEAYKRFARQHGWPDDLRPRAVQILDLLYEQGPQTRYQIARAIGMPWKGSRKSLVSNDPEGSYLAHLMKRGLVVRLGRDRPAPDGAKSSRGNRQGKNVFRYMIPAHVVRGSFASTPKEENHVSEEQHSQLESHRRRAAS